MMMTGPGPQADVHDVERPALGGEESRGTDARQDRPRQGCTQRTRHQDSVYR